MTSNACKRPRVLITEDYVLIQENIRRVVDGTCDVIGVVEDGESALAAVAEHSPDIVLLDVSLPDMSGFTLAQRLRCSAPSVRIIFLTAYGEKAYVDRAFEIGALGYVLKGRIWTDLLPAIRAVASGQSYRPTLQPRDEPG